MAGEEYKDVMRIFRGAGYSKSFTYSELVTKSEYDSDRVADVLSKLEDDHIVCSDVAYGATLYWLSPPRIEQWENELSAITIGRKTLRNLWSWKLVRYTNILLGFSLLTVFIFVYVWVWPSEPAVLGAVLIGLGSFYATVGVYLFSQSHSVYSIAENRKDEDLFRWGIDIGSAAAKLTGGAAVHVFLGILTFAAKPHGFDLPVTGTSVQLSQQVSLGNVESAIFLVLMTLGQFLVLSGLLSHYRHFQWFGYVRAIIEFENSIQD